MSRYKPYSAYRESGVEWIGVVPEHWTTLRLADIGPLAKGNDGTKENDGACPNFCVNGVSVTAEGCAPQTGW